MVSRRQQTTRRNHDEHHHNRQRKYRRRARSTLGTSRPHGLEVAGLRGKIAVEATNAFNGRDNGYESLAHEVRARTNGPVAKAFNANGAVLFDRIDEQRVRPGCLYAADDEAREVTELRIRDAGYDPEGIGGLESARALEQFALDVFAKLAPVFYRFASPGEL
jgi:predicted dinucleotide-binding enzyme